MDPFTIIVFGIIIAGIFLAVILIVPRAREYNETVAHERAAIKALARARGWDYSEPTSGDVKWIISSSNWQIFYDSDFSSESSNPFIFWLSSIPTSHSNRFVCLTEAGLKMMKHPFAKKAFIKIQGFAEKLASKKLKDLPTTGIPTHITQKKDPLEVFQILESGNEFTIETSRKKKYVFTCESRQTFDHLRNSPAIPLIKNLFDQEKNHVHDNHERVARYKNSIEIRHFTHRPNEQHVKKMIEIGEILLKEK